MFKVYILCLVDNFIFLPLEFKNNPTWITPAQLNTMCKAPKNLTVSSTHSLTLSSSVTLVLKNLHLSEPNSYSISLPFSCKSAIITLAPKAKNFLTVDSPNP